MRIKLLPSTFDESGAASPRQHLSCFVVDGLVAVDAGSLAMSTSAAQKREIRDVVLSHAHLDHIAGLPLYIDDLFAHIKRPIQIYAGREVIDVLERDIFNWSVYPRFSELKNEHGAVMEYRPFEAGKAFNVKHLEFFPVSVNHRVPAVGFIISDGKTKIGFSGDTSSMDGFWDAINSEEKLDALLIECAFPNSLEDLANASLHLTPNLLRNELMKFEHIDCPVYVINIKPMYFEEVSKELQQLGNSMVRVFEVGKNYDL